MLTGTADTLTEAAGSRLPEPTQAGFVDKLYRLDGGHSLANDEFWCGPPAKTLDGASSFRRLVG